MEDNSVISTDTYTYGNSNWEDQLTKFNNQEITYDMIGNPLTIGNNILLSWINGRSLNSYQDSSRDLKATYKYNQNGIRISKRVNDVETKYYLEGKRIIYERRGNNLIKYLYDSTGILGLVYNNDVYYYIKNLQGDIIGLLDSTYNKIVSYEYDSWGRVLSVKDNEGNIIIDSNNIGIINPFRYRGYYYDEETSLYYLNSRYYNPNWCRFVNADGIIGANKDIISYNLYVYVSNNPIIFIDKTGTFALSIPVVIGSILNSSTIISMTKAIASITAFSLIGYGGLITDVSDSEDPPQKKKGEHNVYVLANRSNGDVEYVGRTKNLGSAKSRHKHNTARAHLKFVPVAMNVDYPTARGLEQLLIDTCGTKKDNPMNNQINGVDPRKKLKFQIFLNAAQEWVSSDEHFVSCNVDIPSLTLRR